MLVNIFTHFNSGIIAVSYLFFVWTPRMKKESSHCEHWASTLDTHIINNYCYFEEVLEGGRGGVEVGEQCVLRHVCLSENDQLHLKGLS